METGDYCCCLLFLVAVNIHSIVDPGNSHFPGKPTN